MSETSLLRSGLKRDRSTLLMGSLGIALGIGSLTCFLVLGLGLRTFVIDGLVGELPVGTLDVKPSGSSVLMGLLGNEKSRGMGPVIEAAKIQGLVQTDGVAEVVPRLRVDVPMMAWGLQKELNLPKPVAVDVFATGLPEQWVAEDVQPGHVFADPGKGQVIPVLISRRLVTMANSALAATVKVNLTPKLLAGLQFRLMIGKSYMTGGIRGPGKGRAVTCKIVGVSDKAITLGVSVPEGVAERWNREFQKEPRPVAGAWVRLSETRAMSRVVEAIESYGLQVDEGPRLVGIVINGVLAGLVLVASLLLLLAAMIIAQTFYSRVAMRRREYGLYRALGAPRRLIYRLVLSEALIAGGVAGFLGVIVGFGAAYAIEMSTLAALPELPFELTAIALYHPGLILLGIGLALCFAFLGALGPAARAAAVDPAEALELS
ncbi:MAG: ABC transporter permease [Myxococcota bacterium]|nr:hypothetical protein [Myxococcales bacterium]MEC7751043.1 ABC transporter permease [Myxococcota bacterium]